MMAWMRAADKSGYWYVVGWREQAEVYVLPAPPALASNAHWGTKEQDGPYKKTLNSTGAL